MFKKNKEFNRFQVNIILDGFCLSTIPLYQSDVESLISKGILNYTRENKTEDSAGILLTSKAYQVK